jgi:hypothetical protein
MTVRSAHGRAKQLGSVAVVETLPLDELPAGVPGSTAAPEPARDAAGRYRAGHPATIAAARAAGHAKRDRTQLAHTLAVTTEDPTWRTFLRQAEAFRRAQVRMLAGTVGGGACGPAPAALVASAALALAASRMAYTRGDLPLGARLASEVRQHLLGAHELCAREAAARKLIGPQRAPWLLEADDEQPPTPHVNAPIAADDCEPVETSADAATGEPDPAWRDNEDHDP